MKISFCLFENNGHRYYLNIIFIIVICIIFWKLIIRTLISYDPNNFLWLVLFDVQEIKCFQISFYHDVGFNGWRVVSRMWSPIRFKFSSDMRNNKSVEWYIKYKEKTGQLRQFCYVKWLKIRQQEWGASKKRLGKNVSYVC